MTPAATTQDSRSPKRRFGAARWFAVIAAVVVAVLAAATVVWWGPLRERAMDPGIPYETYEPPPAPDYADPTAWAVLPAAGAPGQANVFFIHPTTYDGRDWNAAVDAPRAERLLTEEMIPNYAGPFEKVGRVFAPRYRQSSLYTTLTLREDAREARAFAYRDIKAAFERFRAASDPAAPLVLAGVGQGAVLADRLAREIAADPAQKARLAAVYLIEAAVPAEAYGPEAPLPACAGRAQTGCVAAYISEAHNDAARTRDRLRHAPVWQGEQLVSLSGRAPLCFNPLEGATTDAAAPATANLGGANASGLEWGVRPGFLQHQVGAQCVSGVLKLTKPRSPALRPGLSWTERQRVRPYNVFYADLEADALARVAAMPKAP